MRFTPPSKTVKARRGFAKPGGVFFYPGDDWHPMGWAFLKHTCLRFFQPEKEIPAVKNDHFHLVSPKHHHFFMVAGNWMMKPNLYIGNASFAG